MKRYDDYVLGKLLDKYERSSVSRGENQRSISISYKLNPKDLPEYFDESRLEYEDIHNQLIELEEAGIISMIWKRRHEGQILEKCVLVQENIPDAYRRLHRVQKSVKESRILEVVGKYERQLPAFAEWVSERVRLGSSVKQYLDIDHPEHADRICFLACKIIQNQSEQFLRQFSVSCFRDSKIAEREISAAARIISDFECEGRLCGLDAQEVLEEFMIFRNPSWIMIKGGPWSDVFPGGIGITEKDALRVEWDIRHRVTHVLTIENLTTFHQWKTGAFNEGEQYAGNYEIEELVIYLGGYANRIKREFLCRIREKYPDAVFEHYGDIDCGGFRIWKNLVEGTGIAIKPFRMDVETYLRHLDSGRELTEHDRSRLREMLNDPFYVNQYELFQKMLENGIKLEQEALD